MLVLTIIFDVYETYGAEVSDHISLPYSFLFNCQVRLMKCMKIRTKWCPKLQYLTIIQLKKNHKSKIYKNDHKNNCLC